MCDKVKQIVVLLTGTIKPGDMSFTKLLDPNDRKHQYIDSIMHWLKNERIKVVFVENSNTELSTHFEKYISEDNLEILTFQGNDFDKNLGKGYGELLCLEYAYNNSKFLANADIIFKATGRYKILNFITFLDFYIKNEFDVMVDFRRNLSYCDSRFFAFKPVLLQYLFTYKQIVNDSKNIWFEHILCKAVLRAIENGCLYSPLVTLPRIEGSSGTFNIKYNSSFLNWLKGKIKYDIKFKLLKY